MTLRIVYETLIVFLGLVIAWHFVVVPVYRMATRPRRRGLNSLDDVVGDHNAGEALRAAKRRLGDARAMAQADRVNKQADALHPERNTPEN